MGFCEQLDRSSGPWTSIDDYLTAHGLRPGPRCLEQCTGGVHARTSLHPLSRARDVSAGMGGDQHQAALLLEPLAEGPNFVVQELFDSDHGIAWSGGRRSTFVDNPGHTHIGLRAGVRLQAPPTPPPPPVPPPDPWADLFVPVLT